MLWMLLFFLPGHTALTAALVETQQMVVVLRVEVVVVDDTKKNFPFLMASLGVLMCLLVCSVVAESAITTAARAAPITASLMTVLLLHYQIAHCPW